MKKESSKFLTFITYMFEFYLVTICIMYFKTVLKK
jgi:hypothetical protein